MNFLKKMSSKSLKDPDSGSTKAAGSTKAGSGSTKAGSTKVTEAKISNEVVPAPNNKVGLSSKRDSFSMGEAISELRQEHDVMQLKTFTRWWDSWLSSRGTHVTDLCEQVKNGVLGIQLMEALSGAIVPRYNRSPRNMYMELENQVTFLSTIKSKGLSLVNIGPADIRAGDLKLVLGLTWTLILRYEIQRYGADEMELLRWVKQARALSPPCAPLLAASSQYMSDRLRWAVLFSGDCRLPWRKHHHVGPVLHRRQGLLGHPPCLPPVARPPA